MGWNKKYTPPKGPHLHQPRRAPPSTPEPLHRTLRFHERQDKRQHNTSSSDTSANSVQGHSTHNQKHTSRKYHGQIQHQPLLPQSDTTGKLHRTLSFHERRDHSASSAGIRCSMPDSASHTGLSCWMQCFARKDGGC